MGPTLLFDKSALQALSVDEAVWLDQFFTPVICPIFFVETLADLEKSLRAGRTPEQEVGFIALKTPQMSGWPNAFHGDLCALNILGSHIEMSGRPVIGGGGLVRTSNRTGFKFDVSPEAEAFARWCNREFLETERKFAATWRSHLSALSFDEVIEQLKKLGIIQGKCKTLGEAKSIADSVVTRKDRPLDVMAVTFAALHIPQELSEWVLRRAAFMNYPSLAEFAPYAAYVLTVEIFFYVAVASSLISKERVTNKVDISYIYYLPFCNVFTSADRLHRQCAPLFLRDDQQFLWGLDLKQELKAIDVHFDQLPEEEKEKGLFAIASHPPEDNTLLTTRLWDSYLPRWRSNLNNPITMTPEREARLLRQLRELDNAEPLSGPVHPNCYVTNPDSLHLERRISPRRGKWWQVPKDLKVKKKGDLGR